MLERRFTTTQTKGRVFVNSFLNRIQNDLGRLPEIRKLLRNGMLYKVLYMLVCRMRFLHKRFGFRTAVSLHRVESNAFLAFVRQVEILWVIDGICCSLRLEVFGAYAENMGVELAVGMTLLSSSS